MKLIHAIIAQFCIKSPKYHMFYCLIQLMPHYIRQVNIVKLADILFYLRFRPSVRLCTLIFRCKYLENG